MHQKRNLNLSSSERSDHQADEQKRGSNRPTIGNPNNFLTVLIKMILIVVVGVIGGHLVDDYFRREWPMFAIIFGIMSIFIAGFIYSMYKAGKNGGEEEQ